MMPQAQVHGQWHGSPAGLRASPLHQAATAASDRTVKVKKRNDKKQKKKQNNKGVVSKSKNKKKEHMVSKEKANVKKKAVGVKIQEAAPGVMAKFADAKARTLCDDDLQRWPVTWDPPRGEAAEVHAAVTKFLACDAEHHGQATALWPALLLSAFSEFRAGSLQLDLMLVTLVMMGRCNRSSGAAVHDFIEYSAGSCVLTMQCLLQELAGIALDKCLMEEHDNTTALGLRLWIMEMTKTKVGALSWFGTQCSSFAALCLSVSNRRASNGYQGDLTKQFVRYGNNQMVVTALIFALSHGLGNVAALEQPLSSTMPFCQPLKSVLQFVKVTRVVTWHGSFGANSMKPLQILSNRDMICSLKRKKPSGKSLTLARKGDGGAFTGRKKHLVRSQAYTPLFGKAVADMMLASRL